MFCFYNILDLPRKGTLCHFTDDAVMICIMNKYDVYEILNTFFYDYYFCSFVFFFGAMICCRKIKLKIDYFVFSNIIKKKLKTKKMRKMKKKHTKYLINLYYN